MCLITFTRRRDALNFDHLEFSHNRNDDGFGIMFPAHGRLKIIKSMGKFHELKAMLRDVPEIGPLAIHQRMRTHGATDLERCHPFEVFTKERDDMDFYVMHNGTIRTPHDKDRSDTQIFIEDEFKKVFNKSALYMLHRDADGRKADIDNPSMMNKWIKERIGSNSKLLFMQGNGAVVIVNREAGDDGERAPHVWYSNAYSLPSKYVAPRAENGQWKKPDAAPTTYYQRQQAAREEASNRYYGGMYSSGAWYGWPDEEGAIDGEMVCVNGVWIHKDAIVTPSGNVTATPTTGTSDACEVAVIAKGDVITTTDNSLITRMEADIKAARTRRMEEIKAATPAMVKPRVRLGSDGILRRMPAVDTQDAEAVEGDASFFRNVKDAIGENNGSSAEASSEQGSTSTKTYDDGKNPWPIVWTVTLIRQMSDIELFQEVIADPEGATDFIKALAKAGYAGHVQ